MYIPTLKKIIKRNDVYVERVLPNKGDLIAQVGDKVEPFTKLGMTKVSYGVLEIGKSLRVVKGKLEDGFFYTGEKIGKVGTREITAPFDGNLMKKNDKFILKQSPREFWLLSGVWGEVTDFVDNHSVLIKTQTQDFHLAACTKNSVSGELIVFPNPSELLEMQYLEKYSKDSFGKIIYVGDYVSEAVVKRAVELGVGGILAGSAERKAFAAAERNGIFLGVFTGFGHISTPDFVFKKLKETSNRYVFLQGEKSSLQIPVSKPFAPDELTNINKGSVLRAVRRGLLVQVLVKPYFGWVGKVKKVQGDDIYVILDDAGDVVRVRVPNIVALE